MKANDTRLLFVGLCLSLAGCVSPQGEPDHTASGALIGGATGAIIGSAVGRHPGTGAAIGGAVGIIAGGLIGHSMDQAQQARLRTAAPQTWQSVEQGRPLSLEDIKALARAGVSSELIISQIHSTLTVYHLGTSDIIGLKNAGVSEKVIDYMINTPSTAMIQPPAMVVSSEPPQVVRETVVVAAPGPGYVWIAGSWIWYGNNWRWYGGHWAQPPHPQAHWITGRVEIVQSRRVWCPGHWR